MGVSGTECRRRSKGRGRRSEQRERGLFRALKMRPVRQEAVHSLWSRLFCAPLKTHRVPQEPFLSPNVSENASRTTGGCFAHRIPLPYRKRLFFTPNASENASRTGGSLFEHGTHIPYRRSLFLVRRASENASHWLSGAQKSGWQLPLRGLSTPGRGSGKGPPETSSALAGRRKWWKGPERTK